MENKVYRCRKCNEPRPASAFHKAPRNSGKSGKGHPGRETQCKDCKSDSKRLSRYGLTRKELQQLRKRAKFQCEICKASETTFRTGKQIRLSVDHNHTTGKVRGYLCQRCNVALARFEDNPDLFLKAAEYLIMRDA